MSDQTLFYNQELLPDDKTGKVQFIELKGGSLKITQKGQKVLRRLDAERNCNLIFIFGNARSGKSFMMNCLAGVRGLFEVLNSATPCTRGVDISTFLCPQSTLLKHVRDYTSIDENRVKELQALQGNSKSKEPSGEPLCGFVDVEGQGAEDGTYDTMLALPLLITGKIVLFNHKGAPTVSHMLSQMGVLARAADFIELADNSTDDGEEQQQTKKFGHLHVLFRDFSFEGDVESVKDQLLKPEKVPRKLKTKPGQIDPARAAKERNDIRKLLTDNFESIDLWLFKQPASADALRDIHELEAKTIDPEFVGTVKALLAKVAVQLTSPTLFNGQNMSGPRLISLINQVCLQLNEGGAVNVPSVFRAMEKETVQKVLNDCLEMTDKECKQLMETLPADKKGLGQSLKGLEEKVVGRYNDDLKDCILADEIKTSRETLKAHLEQKGGEVREENDRAQSEFVKKLSQDICTEVKEKFDEFFTKGQPFETPSHLEDKYSALVKESEEKIKELTKDLPGIMDEPVNKVTVMEMMESLQEYKVLKVIQNENCLKELQIKQLQDRNLQQQKNMIEQQKKLEQFLQEEKINTAAMEERLKSLEQEKKEQAKKDEESRRRIQQQQEELQRLRAKRKRCVIL